MNTYLYHFPLSLSLSLAKGREADCAVDETYNYYSQFNNIWDSYSVVAYFSYWLHTERCTLIEGMADDVG